MMKKAIIWALIIMMMLIQLSSCDVQIDAVNSETISTSGSEEKTTSPTETSSNTETDATSPVTDETEAQIPRVDIERFEPEGAGYVIEKTDGGYRLILDNMAEYADKSKWMCEAADLLFESVNDFKDRVTQGKLEEWEKATMAQCFPKDEQGNILACDFNHIYIPTMPDGMTVSGVSWSGGETYTIYASSEEQGFFDFKWYSEKDEYDRVYQENYVQFFDNPRITITKVEEVADRQATVTYHNTAVAEMKRVQYTIESGSKTLVIDELYRLRYYQDAAWNEEVSDTVPYKITVYGIDGDKYYKATVRGFTERPSVDWLLKLGVTEYVEDNTVSK